MNLFITLTPAVTMNLLTNQFSEFAGIPFKSVDIAKPEVLIGGLLGSMIIFYFTGLSISAVGRTAHEVRPYNIISSCVVTSILSCYIFSSHTLFRFSS